MSWKLSIPGFEGIAFGVPSIHALSTVEVEIGTRTSLPQSEIAAAKSDEGAVKNVLIEDTEDVSYWADKQQSSTQSESLNSYAN